MNNLLQTLSDTWNDPAMRHAAIVHLPIALSIFSPLILLFSAIRPDSKPIRGFAVALMAVIGLAAYMAMNSGENAEGHLGGNLSASVRDLIHEHEEAGEKVWLMAAGIMVLVVAGFVGPRGWRIASSWLGALSCFGLIGWVSTVAHLGGTAVYKHGAGIKAMATPDFDPSSPPADPRLADFRSSVYPLLSGRCMGCHSHSKPASGLDLTTARGWLAGGESGLAAVIPGKPEDSRLILAVHRTDPELQMPPREPLSAAEIKILEDWIRNGAVWEDPQEAATRNPSRESGR